MRTGPTSLENAKRFTLPADDRQDPAGHFGQSPTGPSVVPPRAPLSPTSAPRRAAVGNRRRPSWSVVFFALLITGVGIRAYRDLSRPEAWAYWKESYFSPSMTSSVIARVGLDGPSNGRPALAIHGTIGAASAGWL